MKNKADVVIVGGGIIGCSVAYHLAKRGAKEIILIDMLDDIGKGETGYTVAMLMHQTENEYLSCLAKESIKEYLSYQEAEDYQAFQREFGASIAFQNTGSILYTTKPENEGKIRNRVAVQNRLHIKTKRLTPEDIKKIIPFINADNIIIGAYCALDGYIDYHSVLQFYKWAAKQKGVEFNVNTKVEGIVVENRQVKGIITSKGTVKTDIVINAAGGMGHLLGNMVGIKIPMRNEKRNVFVLEPPFPIGSFPILEDIDEGSRWYFRPEGKKSILFGVGPTSKIIVDNFSPDFFNLPVEEKAWDMLVSFINDRIPEINELKKVGRPWAGLRSITPDDLPILGPTDGVNGFINCCGLSGFGITNAPICGHLVAEFIMDGSTRFPLEPYLVSRFQYSHWEVEDNDRKIGRRSIKSVVEDKFRSSPIYLYNAEIALNRLRVVKKAFPNFEILYSLKANPNSLLVSEFRKEGVNAEVASLRELDVAIRSKFNPSNIVYGGPGKTRAQLIESVQKKIGTIDIESERESKEIEEIGRRLGKRIRITLRVNTKHSPSQAGEYMAGAASRYGIDQEIIVDKLKKLSPKFVEILGIHAHIASQVLDPEALLDHYGKTARLAKDISSELGFELKVINFGGGIGVPYSRQEAHIDIFDLGEKTCELLNTIFPDPRSRPKFQLELGRLLVAECGIFITRIVEVKCSRGKSFIITDSGINAFSRPAMKWAQQHQCTIVSKENQPPTRHYTVVGTSCLPGDILCESAELPNPEEGDILAIQNAGAYGYTMSMLRWASQLIPREVVYVNNKFRLPSGMS